MAAQTEHQQFRKRHGVRSSTLITSRTATQGMERAVFMKTSKASWLANTMDFGLVDGFLTTSMMSTSVPNNTRSWPWLVGRVADSSGSVGDHDSHRRTWFQHQTAAIRS
jgi:hypothetical protein